MSAWTEQRDKITGTAKDFLRNGIGEVTEGMKQDATKWLHDEGLPMLEEVGSNIMGQLVEQGKKETSPWCKFRDLLFFPALIRLALWGGKVITEKTYNETVSE